MARTQTVVERSPSDEAAGGTALARQYGLDLAARFVSTFFLTPDSPVMGFGATRPYTPNNSFLAEIHSPAEIGVILSGKTERYFPGWHFTATPGDVWMHGMWEPHGWQVLVPETQRVVVDFLPEYLEGEMVGERSWWSLFAAPPQERPRVRREDRPRVLALANELHGEIEREDTGWQVAVRLLVLQLLYVLGRNWTPPEGSGERPGEAGLSRLLPALNLVRNTDGRGVPLARAAAACGLRRSQFSAEFRRTLGLPFGQFRRRAQLAAAAHQFLTTDLTVRAVAERTGFSDASYLSRAFLRHYGCTPGRYRVQMEQAGSEGPCERRRTR